MNYNLALFKEFDGFDIRFFSSHRKLWLIPDTYGVSSWLYFGK